MSARITLDHVRVTFGGRTVFSDLSLALAPGALTAIIGPSGCGKTTLIRLIAGLIAPDSGVITRDPGTIGVVFQDPRLLPWRTARDNVALGALAVGIDKAARRQKAETLLAQCGFAPEDMRKYPQALSGGMRARVALARALLGDPAILLLDEPFNGLDPARRRGMQDLTRDRVDQNAVTAVCVTHDLQEAARIADAIVVLTPNSGIIHRETLSTPPNQRTPRFVTETVVTLCHHPAVITALALEGV